jgi:hypothetical protein
VYKILLISLLLGAPMQPGLAAEASRPLAAPLAASEQLTQDASQFPVKPSQAALIAQQAYPGAKVLGVKLLPSGEYAVTLKVGGSVQKVLVNATSGAIG